MLWDLRTAVTHFSNCFILLVQLCIMFSILPLMIFSINVAVAPLCHRVTQRQGIKLSFHALADKEKYLSNFFCFMLDRAKIAVNRIVIYLTQVLCADWWKSNTVISGGVDSKVCISSEIPV